jgi:uncharacterized repeat protein (TIGR03803 family)
MTKCRLLTAASLALVLAATIGSARAQYTDLYVFGSNGGLPTYPTYSGIMAQGRDGNFYSTTSENYLGGGGTAFRMTPTGTVTVITHFTDFPTSGLTLGTDGNYYGTAPYFGGPADRGSIFKINAAGTLTTLFNFVDAGLASSPPVQGVDGNFYGTTSSGGTVGDNGTVYRITPSGTFTTLHSFGGDPGSDCPVYYFVQGCINGPLTEGVDGYLYGTTVFGGTHNLGTVFRMTDTGTYTVLHNFDGAHGSIPIAPLVQGADGNFYGTTTDGGAFVGGLGRGGGVVFKITPDGTFTVLHYFTGGNDGSMPLTGLVAATDGNFYGGDTYGGPIDPSNPGVIYRITPSGDFTVMYAFDKHTEGSPQVTMLQHTNGKLYGSTNGGDTSGLGVFYSFDIGAAPFITFLPAARKVGNTVEILGQGFTGTTAVSLNGTHASFHVNSDTYLTATVPDNLLTGFITVTTPGGTLTSNKPFQVRPQITGFSPTSGAPGTTVVITGDSFTQTTKIKFGNGKAINFVLNSDKQITAVVPSGATTGKIAVTLTTGPASYSTTDFTVTK